MSTKYSIFKTLDNRLTSPFVIQYILMEDIF